jgi:glycine hydroxymethyltransferase
MMIKSDLELKDFDEEIWQAIESESLRQEEHIELIASENYVSKRVLEAQGSIMTNKYAEGYSGKRYYGGCEFVDIAEDLAVARAKELFAADYANVQPHSGSQANAAVMMALLEPMDLIQGMSLMHGGHLTHGSTVNYSGKMYRAVQYGLDQQTGIIDYDALEAQAIKYKPKLIVAGFSAYSQHVDWARFRAIADEVGAYLMADIAHVAGLIAVGLYPSPLPYADVVTSTTHKTLRGPRGGLILARKNSEIEKKISAAVFPGSQGGPLMHVIAAKAVAFAEALHEDFFTYQKQILLNAKAMAKTLQHRGYDIVSGGTENHLMLVSLLKHGINGRDANNALGEANITANKNSVPGDPLSPFVTSGLRFGTPAITTRGFKEPEVVVLTNYIADILDDITDKAKIAEIKEKVLALSRAHPVYG